MKHLKSFLGILLISFAMSFIYAQTSENSSDRRFWGSSTSCSETFEYGGNAGCGQSCITTYYVLWLPVSSSHSVPNVPC